MGKIFFAVVVVLLLNIGLALAHGHDFAETKQLIDSGISCDELTDEQLEALGEYYMEQMHPGEAHEIMDQMMGGEGSESLKQMHVQMAKRLYCNEDVGGMMGSGGMMSGNMMNMMPMMMNMMDDGNMMGSNMMNLQNPQTSMVGNWGYFGYWNFINIFYIILLIGLIVLVYLWIIKL